MRQGPNFWKSLKYLRVPWKCSCVIGRFKRSWNSFPKSTVWFGNFTSWSYWILKTSDRLSKFHLIYVYTGARKQHHWMEIWSYLLLGDSILTVFCCCQTNKTYRWGPELGGEIAIFKIQETKILTSLVAMVLHMLSLGLPPTPPRISRVHLNIGQTKCQWFCFLSL